MKPHWKEYEARTIAMKGSNELEEVALFLLFQQVKELGIEAWAAGFNIWHRLTTAAYIDWITGPNR